MQFRRLMRLGLLEQSFGPVADEYEALLEWYHTHSNQVCPGHVALHASVCVLDPPLCPCLFFRLHLMFVEPVCLCCAPARRISNPGSLPFGAKHLRTKRVREAFAATRNGTVHVVILWRPVPCLSVLLPVSSHLQSPLGNWDTDKIMHEYYTSYHGIAVIDNAFSPQALAELLAFCEQSTIFHDDGRNQYLDDNGALRTGEAMPVRCVCAM